MTNKKTIIAVLLFGLIVLALAMVRSNVAVAPQTIQKSTTARDTHTAPGMTATALLADGCFWCVEHDLRKVTGVIDVVSGYADGNVPNPTYENYAREGYREVVEVMYDPTRVSFANLVEHIIKHGDPTDQGGSFHDRGSQYAPAIYYSTPEEKTDAERVIASVDALKVFPEPLPLVVIPTVQFWPAEDYHQDYAEKNPVRYSYYRNGSGRDVFIKAHWGDTADTFTVTNLPEQNNDTSMNIKNETGMTKEFNAHSWDTFVKPDEAVLRSELTPLQYQVTQEAGTEPSVKNEYDKNYDEGIYVDIVSGEPLYFSKDKFDSGTGWPSFVKPISDDVVTKKEDKGLFTSRTEIRSKHADSHVGHVFPDGPTDRGGLRYCMNSAAMRFIPKADMEVEGYGYLVSEV